MAEAPAPPAAADPADDEAPAQSLRDYLPSLPTLPAVRLEWRARRLSAPSLNVRTWDVRKLDARAWSPGRWEWVLLALILVSGAVFRFTGLNWDGGHHLHPDERFLTMVEGAIRPSIVTQTARDGSPQYQPANLLSFYFDTARSGLNPHNVGFGFFVYGTFPLFFVRWLASLLNSVGYDKIHLLGRALSGISDLGTVALIFLVGRRLYGARVGLLAAALLAFCVLHIQHAHFFVMDSFLVTLVVATFYFCVDVAETGRLRSFALAGLMLGLALATKLSMALFVPTLGLAAVIYLWRTELQWDFRRQGLSIESVKRLWSNGSLSRMITGGLVAAAIAALVFRVLQPYAFAGPGLFDLRLNPKWLDNMAYQSKTQAGTVDLPPSIQWAGTEPWLWPWRQMVNWGMGIPMGLTVWAGFVAATAVVLWRGRWQHLLVVSWVGLCFFYNASVLNKTMRYLLPAYPFFILLGAWALIALYDRARRARAAVGAAVHVAVEDSPVVDGRFRAWPRRERGRGSALERFVGRWGVPAAVALTAFVVVASAAWSFAYTRIYTRTTTREAASLWIYQNVPRGSAITFEHWDDPIPLRLPNYDTSWYPGVEMPLYDTDEPKKVDTIVRNLTRADYLVMSSNRLYGSIPRIPQRYPMTTEYYRRLFAGDLGFELVHTQASYPNLGPWVINDDSSEELFTVYDHPKVLIYQKRPDFSAEKVREILSAVPLDNVVQVLPLHVGRPNLMQPPALLAANTAGGTWSLAFNSEGLENRVAPLVWWLAMQGLGVLAAPLLWLALGRLPDRGYGLSKPLGLLGVSWLAWSLAGYRVLPWTRLTLMLSVLALAAASVLVLRRRGREWLAWVRGHRRLIVSTEVLFLATFLVFTAFRAVNPDLWHPARGGEKPMEFSYLNAVIRTTYFPAYDPWFAGGYLNYYYFGYVLVAALTKLTGVIPSIAFNVAVPALYALTAAGCFSFAYNLSRLGGSPRFGFKAALGAGIAGFVCVAFVGNLDGFSQLVERLARLGQVGMATVVPGVAGLVSLVAGIPAVLFGGRPLEPFDFWRSSRVIPNNTINEFPFWTFLFADLHAHMISIPFQVAALGVLLNLAYSGRRAVEPGASDPAAATGVGGAPGSAGSLGATNGVSGGLSGARSWWKPEGPEFGGPGARALWGWLWRLIGWRRVAEIVLVAWVVGALYVINSWEFPTYLLLAAGTFLIAEFTAQRTLTLGGLARAGISAAAVFVLAKPLFRPFWAYYQTFYSSVSLWTADKSRLDHYLIIHGLFVFSLVTLVVMLAGPTWRRTGWGRYLAARWRWLGDMERFSAVERALALTRRPPATGYVALAIAGGIPALVALARGLPLIAFLIVLLCAVAAVAWERRRSPALLLASLLAGTGCALSIFVEFFTLQGDIGRMNTVFKFYLQIWVMWGLVSAVALAWAVERLLAPRLVAVSRPVVAPAPFVPGPLLYESPAATGYGDGEVGSDTVVQAAGENGVGSEDLTPGPYRRPVPGDGKGSRELPGGDDGHRDAAMPESAGRPEPLPAPAAQPPNSNPKRLTWWQWSWLAAAGTLVLAACAYPLGGTPARLADRFSPLPPTLDGMAYMQYATITDGSSDAQGAPPGGATIRAAADYDAIQWLLANVQGTPVILEASIPEYRWGSRIAKYTGLPTVLGWRWHQAQQRGTYAPLVDQRLSDVKTTFNDPSPSRVTPLLRKYRVRYIYVGDLERAYYNATGLAKFSQMQDELRPVYEKDGVAIYEVVERAGT